MAIKLSDYKNNFANTAAKNTLELCKTEIHKLSLYNIDDDNPLGFFVLGKGLYGPALKRILKIPESAGSNWEMWVSNYLKTDRKGYWHRFSFWSKGRAGKPNMFISTSSSDLVIVLGYKDNQALVVDTFDPTKEKWVKIKTLVPVFLDSHSGVSEKQLNKFKEYVAPKIKTIQETFEKLLENPIVENAPEYKNNWTAEEYTNKEREDMKNTTFTKGMFQTNKEALKQVGYLNAGRSSNKILKEAVSPFIRMAFKPNFMQRVAMKMFKIENPADRILKSEYSDLLCAQLAQAIIELRGVENEHVREVAKAGIVYSSLKLSEKIPLEDMMDKTVEVIEEQSKGVISKIKESK